MYTYAENYTVYWYTCICCHYCELFLHKIWIQNQHLQYPNLLLCFNLCDLLLNVNPHKVAFTQWYHVYHQHPPADLKLHLLLVAGPHKISILCQFPYTNQCQQQKMHLCNLCNLCNLLLDVNPHKVSFIQW